MRSVLLLLCILIGTIQLGRSQHTFSIVAVDPLTGEVGSAGASCIDDGMCGGCGGAIIISNLLPGVGAMNAQATVCIPNSNLQNGMNYMALSMNADEILQSTLANDACVFGDTSARQYGVAIIDTTGIANAAGFTGQGAMDYKNHNTGIYYSVQGNILQGQHILDSMEAGFLSASGDLACRLMAGLQGANMIGADSRCTDSLTSSLSAFIRVAQPTDGAGIFSLDLNVSETPTKVEPIDSLQSLFDAVHNCTTASMKQQVRKTRVWCSPNPFRDKTTFHIRAANPNTAVRISIFDMLGKLAGEKTTTREVVTFTSNELGNGVYLYRVTSEDKFIGAGKLLVE